MDQETERQVWQRVTGQTAPGHLPSLRGMELRCRESAAAYRQLAMSRTGQARETLLHLHRQAASSADRIRGIRILAGEEPEKRSGYADTSNGYRLSLAQALRRCQESLADCRACERQEFACVFREMARQEELAIGEILQLMGMSG